MSKFKIIVNGKEYEVELGNVGASPTVVHVDGKAYSVQWEREQDQVIAKPAPAEVVEEAAPTPARPKSVDASGKGELVDIVAPMPGKILKVSASVGDEVAEQDTLCTLEAMKMESAIQSTATGTVVSVNVTPGQAVQYGDVLFVVKKTG